MIELSTRVLTEDPIKYVWKSLRYFTDNSYTIERINKIHNIKDKSHDSNIKKQAKQLAYCIRQAEEYFNASSHVGLPTRPVLLYYGIVSLSQALVLLKQNGEYSLDALRKIENHKHHGLELLGNFKSNINNLNDVVVQFLNSIQCKCFIKNNKPWGQFANFYNSIEPCVINIEIDYYNDNTLIETELTPMNCAEKIEIENLSKKTFNVLEIIKTLPDLYNTLHLNGIIPNLCRGQIKTIHRTTFKKDLEGIREISKKTLENYYVVDFATPEQKKSLISFYKKHYPNIEFLREHGNNFSFRQIFQLDEKEFCLYYPDLVESIFGKIYYIVHPDEYLPELAAHFIILYCLGMISRYYPDIWIKVIDENVQIAELIDGLLDVVYRKFPYLILDQMTGIHHSIQR